MLAPGVINSGIEIVFGELLIASEEKVVGVKDVVGSAIWRGISVEDGQSKLIESPRRQRQSSLQSLGVSESWKHCPLIIAAGGKPCRAERIINSDWQVQSTDADKSIAEVAPSLSLGRHGHQEIV